MEKLMYAVWKPDAMPAPEFRDRGRIVPPHRIHELLHHASE